MTGHGPGGHRRTVTSAELDAPLMPYGEALGRITGAFTPLPPLRVPLASALGLVLAEDVVAADLVYRRAVETGAGTTLEL